MIAVGLAGTQSTFAGAIEQHGLDRVVIGPRLQRRVDGGHHLVRQRIDRLRPVQGDAADPTLGTNKDAALV